MNAFKVVPHCFPLRFNGDRKNPHTNARQTTSSEPGNYQPNCQHAAKRNRTNNQVAGAEEEPKTAKSHDRLQQRQGLNNPKLPYKSAGGGKNV